MNEITPFRSTLEILILEINIYSFQCYNKCKSTKSSYFSSAILPDVT